MSNPADKFLRNVERQMQMCERIDRDNAEREKPTLQKLRRKIDAGEVLDLHEYMTAQHMRWV